MPVVPSLTQKGNITVTTALVLPVVIFLFMGFVDLLIYGLGMVELSFTTSQLAQWYREGESLAAVSSQSLMGFSDLCLQPDGTPGHSVTIETLTYGAVSFEALRVSCQWDFIFMDTLWPELAFPTNFTYQVLLGSL